MEVKAWDLPIIFGIILGIIGCFSPWGGHSGGSFGLPLPDPKVGTEFLSGIYCLYGFISVAVFQLVFMLKRKVYSIFAVLILGLMTSIISGNWLLNADRLWFNTWYSGSLPYTAWGGVYMTLIGAMIVSAMAFLYIAAAARKRHGSSRPRQKK